MRSGFMLLLHGLPRRRVFSFLAISGALSCAERAPDGEGIDVSGPEGSVAERDSRTPGGSLDVPSGAGKGFRVGSVASVLGGLRTETTKVSRRMSLPLGPFGHASAVVEDFYEERGQLSMVGGTTDSKDSEFIFKADAGNVYGWVVYRDRDLAYEYTTDEFGDVLVERVPVTKIFPVCNLEVPDDDGSEPAAPDSVLRAAPLLPPHVGTYAGADVTKLQSLPGAPKVWYINLTDVMNGSTPIGQTATDVWQTWQSLSAALSAFKVNVTTDPAVYAAAGTANSGVARMANVNEGSSSCGLNVFGSTRACDVHRYRNGYATGRILAHEVGHGVGLNHDGGNDGGEYFNGLPAFQWTPLMGNIWPGDRWTNALYQWSKGEYTSATEDQDDFALIDRHLDFRDDDVASVAPLKLTGTSVPAAVNWGQIGRNTDTDSYSFRIGASGGHATLRIDRIEYLGGAMLDVDASILNGSGTVVRQNNAAVARNAQLDVDLAAGDYTLLIKGGAEGTPANGFSNYSSVGFYSIDGTLTGAVDPGPGGAGGGGGMGAGGSSNAGAAGLAGGVSAGAGGVSAGAGGASAGAGGAGAGTAGTPSGGAGAGSSGAPNGGTGDAGSGATGGGTGGLGGSIIGAGNGSGGSSGPGANAGSGTTLPTDAGAAEDAGCGCRVTGSQNGSRASFLGFGLFLVLRLRRRSKASAKRSA